MMQQPDVTCLLCPASIERNEDILRSYIPWWKRGVCFVCYGELVRAVSRGEVRLAPIADRDAGDEAEVMEGVSM